MNENQIYLSESPISDLVENQEAKSKPVTRYLSNENKEIVEERKLCLMQKN